MEEFFLDRKDAGKKLARLLLKYKSSAVVFALPRGGVVVGGVVAEQLNCPLDIIVVKKIGHPVNSEFAIGAVTSSGLIVIEESRIGPKEQEWLRVEVEKKLNEAKRALNFYKGPTFHRGNLSAKIALVIDDGVTTGSTILAAIEEVKSYRPKKVIIGIPVVPKEAIPSLRGRVDEVITVIVPEFFLGAVGAYYDDFEPVDENEVLKMIKQSNNKYERIEDK